MVGFRWPYEVGPDTQPLGEKLDQLRALRGRVIAKFRGLTALRIC